MKKFLALLCILSVLWCSSYVFASEGDVFTVPEEELAQISECVGYNPEPNRVFVMYSISEAPSSFQAKRLTESEFSGQFVVVQQDDSSQWVLVKDEGGYRKSWFTGGSKEEYLQVNEVRELAEKITREKASAVWCFRVESVPGSMIAGVAECGNQEIIVPVGASWKKFYGIDQEWYTTEEFVKALHTIPDPNGNAGTPNSVIYVRIAAGVALVLFVAYLFGRKEFRKVSVQK